MTERFSIGDRVLQDVYCGCIPAILDGGIPCTQGHVLKLLNELDDENEYLKETNQKVIRLIHEAIVEALDGARYNAERLLEEALQELEKDWEVVE